MNKFIGWVSIETYNDLLRTKTMEFGKLITEPFTILGNHITQPPSLDLWNDHTIGILYDISNTSIVNQWCGRSDFKYTLQNVTPLRTIITTNEYMEVIEEYNNERLK